MKMERTVRRVVALDPGGTTGYLIAYIGEPKRLYFSYAQHAWREDELYNALHKLRPDTIVCESFEYRQGSRAGLDLTPAHLIGVIRLYATQCETQLIMQTAAEGKGFWKDNKLKGLNIYNRSFSHGRDALRHFLHNYMFGSLAKYNDEPEMYLVEEQYLLDSYFNRVVL
jgi:hypothetical protein